jgi:DNA-directed RNA polymerase specialized sigma24 family protein
MERRQFLWAASGRPNDQGGMAPPRKPPPPGLSAAALAILDGHERAQRLTRRVLGVLADRGVPDQKREDLAQDVLVAALQGDQRRQVQASPAPIRYPHAYLRRIARNKDVDRVRYDAMDALGHATALDDDDDEGGILDTTPDPTTEEGMPIDRIPLNHLSPVQRRVFVLRYDVGMKFSAIADVERERWQRDSQGGGAASDGDYCMSRESARRCYREACARLGDLVEGDKRRNRAILPLWLGLADGDVSEPPAEVVDRVLGRVYARLGIDPAAPSAPPPSGTRPIARPAPRAPLGSLANAPVAGLAVFGGLVLGALLAAGMVQGCSRDERRSAPEAAPVLAAPAPSGAASVAEPAPLAALSAVVPDPQQAREPARGRAPARPLRPCKDGLAEAEMYERALGLATSDSAAALEVLLAERGRYPEGEHAADALALSRRLCAELHDARCP